MTNFLTVGQKIARDLCEMDAPQSDGVEVCPISLANRIDDEIESLRQQLAAALAACKQKDEALMKLAEHDGKCDELDLDEGGCHKPCSCGLTDALATKPDDSALKAWLGEPVWASSEDLKLVEEYGYKMLMVDDAKRVMSDTPLYSPKGLK